jgi:hypothetical protein
MAPEASGGVGNPYIGCRDLDPSKVGVTTGRKKQKKEAVIPTSLRGGIHISVASTWTPKVGLTGY